MTSPIIGTLRVHQDPYPHLRDDNGTVLARDYEHEEKTAYIVRAVNSHEALVEALSRIAAVKYPEADTLYALKATIDFVRDQANAALSTAESKK